MSDPSVKDPARPAHQIAVLAGDGVGEEIMRQAIKALRFIGQHSAGFV